MQKCNENPLIVPANVIPSREDLQVDGIFNCGVSMFQGDVLLLCRVAESFINNDPGLIKIPVVTGGASGDSVEMITIDKASNPQYDYSDSRSVWTTSGKERKIMYLTSLSHFRLARSKDGVHFKVDEKPTIFPRSDDEEWGIEDPRITFIDGSYVITYTSVTSNGPATSLIITDDFAHFERKGVIFAPENKDVAIFPEKINGMYCAFNRPVPCSIGYPDIWLAQSPDLIHWGGQRYFYGTRDNEPWESGRVGGGAVPFLTDSGWVKIYHASDSVNRYCLGAFLLDRDDPSRIIAKTREPIVAPDECYEVDGFFGNVVFTCGCILNEEIVNIYYGAADDKICMAQIEIAELLDSMSPMK